MFQVADRSDIVLAGIEIHIVGREHPKVIGDVTTEVFHVPGACRIGSQIIPALSVFIDNCPRPPGLRTARRIGDLVAKLRPDAGPPVWVDAAVHGLEAVDGRCELPDLGGIRKRDPVDGFSVITQSVKITVRHCQCHRMGVLAGIGHSLTVIRMVISHLDLSTDKKQQFRMG